MKIPYKNYKITRSIHQHLRYFLCQQTVTNPLAKRDSKNKNFNGLIMEDNIEQLRKEVEHWKNLYNQELMRTRQLEQQLGVPAEHVPKPVQPPQPPQPQSQSPQPPPAQQTIEPVVQREEPERENIKTKLRLACSSNDRALLEEAIAEAEALGMDEVHYARKKLNSLLARE